MCPQSFNKSLWGNDILSGKASMTQHEVKNNVPVTGHRNAL